MAEYIDREKLRMYPLRWEFCDKENADPLFIYGVESLMEYVEWLPAADVAPVVHGKWAPSEENPGFLVCSACGDCYVVDEWADGKKWRYCPACGAKMDGKDEGDGQKD